MNKIINVKTIAKTKFIKYNSEYIFIFYYFIYIMYIDKDIERLREKKWLNKAMY